MRIDRFQMERTQCLYENEVDFNLSESGVQPLTARELLTSDGAREAFLDTGLKYAQSNGSPELREHIASFYPGAAASNVLVTTGTSEANFSTLWGLLDKTGRAAIMIPNYLQAWGLARAYAARADAYRLVEREENGVRRWALDIESLRKAVTKRTKLILVTNPNNPTGAVLTAAEMDEIVRLARQVGAWIVADEVYRGAEVASDQLTPTFWGRYPKVIVTAGLSKAFGMPGVRVGWIVGPERTVAHLWSYQDYTTLTPSVLSDRLARIATEPGRREQILARTRLILHTNLPQLERWIHTHDDIFSFIRPLAGAIVLVKYRLPIPSARLFERLRVEHSVLITPGAHFGIGKYIRIGYGYDIRKTLAGLGRVDEFLNAVTAHGNGKRVSSAPPHHAEAPVPQAPTRHSRQRTLVGGAL
jgi:aspartate/methionine/tyrosine aminotransferase